jgi:hypothetical protein
MVGGHAFSKYYKNLFSVVANNEKCKAEMLVLFYI